MEDGEGCRDRCRGAGGLWGIGSVRICAPALGVQVGTGSSAGQLAAPNSRGKGGAQRRWCSGVSSSPLPLETPLPSRRVLWGLYGVIAVTGLVPRCCLSWLLHPQHRVPPGQVSRLLPPGHPDLHSNLPASDNRGYYNVLLIVSPP